MRFCRGILTVYIVAAGVGTLQAESLLWQYGTKNTIAPSAQSSSGSQSSVIPLEESQPLEETQESSDIKLTGTDPRPTGSKITLQLSSLLNSQWGMLTKPGLNLKNAWNALIKKKFIKSKKSFACSNSPITVAIVDTGVDFTHQNLKNVAWVNTKELNGKKGVDDDKNGFIDDVNGWDFTTNSPIIIDGHGHGTHLAGIISGQSQEPNGFKGVCPGIRIMSVRYFASDLTGIKNLENTVKAIRYATQNGANIINYSGGGASFAQNEFDALKEATEKGVLIVAAAGNERSDVVKKPYFPASYDLANIISVAGIGPEGKLIPASNWGKSVDVAAPGGGILSLQQNQSYGFMNGTSQATAFVSGLAGLLWTMKPKLKAADIKALIEKSVAKSSDLKGKVASGGHVDAELAVKMLATYKAKRNSRSKFNKTSTARILSGLKGKPRSSFEN
ncbi:MAG: S8 family peptidase [Bdellovibrionota bacterium]